MNDWTPNIYTLYLNIFLESIEFDSENQICRIEPMECIFPFVDIDGQTHESCTKSRLTANMEYIDDEIFYWCATEVDEDRNMKAWGKCDESTCQTGGKIFTLKIHMIIFSFYT